ncbi:dTDP-4-dehydrorhamnose reductase [Anaerolentibacter hominis]|uniref:dTDP-4-dehydrorhamnose reductase n=1 Tax=Anaerolentibacter hominis TaxID=3079009 RepID=UPI0031B82694
MKSNPRRILIAGAGGQLGLALAAVLGEDPANELLLYGPADMDSIKPLDVRDKDAVSREVRRVQPDVIINGAAFTAVDLCESMEEEAYAVNAEGACNLAAAAAENGCVLVHISTDYVFDGTAKEPYTEDSVPNPVSAYGRTKLAGEKAVMESGADYFLIRTAWLYGEGKNFVRTMLRLSETNPEVRVVADQYGSPTSALELARMIAFLIQTDEYGLYHGTCEGVTTWYEFAEEIFRLAGKDTKVIPITSDQFPSAAKRPAYSVLENKRLNERFAYRMSSWQDALAQYMEHENRR